MAERPEPKISTSEAVLIGMFLLILDAIDLIPIAGDLTDVAGAPLILYYYTKHINGVAYIVSEILDLIPIVQEIPSRSIVWWGTVAFDRFAPAKVEEAVEKLGEEAEGKEGGGELEGEGGLGAETSEGGQRGASSAERVEEEGVRGSGTKEGVQDEESRQNTESGTTEKEAADMREGGEPGGESESPEENGGQKNGNGEDISATESEEEPMAVTEGQLFTQSGDESSSSTEEKGEDEEAVEEKARAAPPRHSGNTVSIDSSKKWQRNQRRKKTKPSTADVIPPEEMAA